MEARVLVMDLIEKEKVPPVLEVTFCVAGVTCRLEFGTAVMVPGPVTVMLTLAVLPLFFRTDTDPVLELIEPPVQVAVGGAMKVPPPPETPQGLSSKCEKLPATTEDGATSAVALTLVVVMAAGVETVVSIVTSPDPAT